MSTPAGHPPICRDCAHYRSASIGDYARCARNIIPRINLVTGLEVEIGSLPAEIERMSEHAGHLLPANRCTESGIFFKPAPVVTRTRIYGQPEPSAFIRFGRWVAARFV